MVTFMRNAAIALPMLIASAPALAGGYYSAQPAAAVPAGTKLVLRDTVWACGAEDCAAGRSNSRPTTVCETLARKIGALRSFTAGGAALPPEQLQKCNARAK